MESLKVLSIEKGNKDSKDFAIPCYRYTTTISVFSPTIIEDTLLKILKELNGNIERVAENLLLKKFIFILFVIVVVLVILSFYSLRGRLTGMHCSLRVTETTLGQNRG
jgi:hypothetical protein